MLRKLGVAAITVFMADQDLGVQMLVVMAAIMAALAAQVRDGSWEGPRAAPHAGAGRARGRGEGGENRLDVRKEGQPGLGPEAAVWSGSGTISWMLPLVLLLSHLPVVNVPLEFQSVIPSHCCCTTAICLAS